MLWCHIAQGTILSLTISFLKKLFSTKRLTWLLQQNNKREALFQAKRNKPRQQIFWLEQEAVLRRYLTHLEMISEKCLCANNRNIRIILSKLRHKMDAVCGSDIYFDNKVTLLIVQLHASDGQV